MRDWKQEVARRLTDLQIDPARHALIVEEVALHLEDRHRSLIARGTGAADAEQAVLKELSDSALLRRRLREVERRPPSAIPAPGGDDSRGWIASLWQDVRYGLRVLRRSPGFTVVAALTLGLGVGANTAIFAVMNTVMLRPLPYPNPEQLVRVWESNPAKGWPRFSASHPTFLDWQAQNRSFERMAAQTGTNLTLTSSGDAEVLRAFAVTSDLLPLLRIRPALGRNFNPEETRIGGDTRAAILTHYLWQRRFGGDPAILGQRLTMNNQPFQVVGVLPESFATSWGGPQLDLLVPLAPDPARSRSDHRLLVVGRLKEGVSFEQGQSEMKTLAAQLAKQYPESNGGWTIDAARFYDWLVPRESRESLVIMLGAVALVLLIACGNIASLLLARAAARDKEFSVRIALGARRSRIVRQLLVEAALLSFIAAAIGILIAFLTTRLVVSTAPQVLPRLGELTIDPVVLGFALAISLVAAIIFGLAPAIQSSRASVSDSLKEGARSSGGRARHRLRAALVVGEVALSVALLIGAGLLMRSFWRLQQVNPGFNLDRLVTMNVNLPRPAYDAVKSRAFYERLLPAVAALPGVRSAATSSDVPLSGGNTSSELTVPGKTMPPGVQASADWRIVSDRYFTTLGIPLRGRDFNAMDALTDEKGRPLNAVTIISEETARRYWPGEDPVGKTIVIHSFTDTPYTIIGVAGDVRSFGLDTEPRPMVYGPALAFASWNPMALNVRSSIDPDSHVASIRAAVRAIDPNVPVYAVRRLEDLLTNSLGPRRFNVYLLGCFAAIALVLACSGLFGVLAYLVAQRTRDIGIRMALGASRRDVFRLIVGQGMTLAAAGAILGVAAGYGGARLMRTLLFAVGPADAVTFSVVPIVLMLVALIACYAPARRATRVDPLVALRAE